MRETLRHTSLVQLLVLADKRCFFVSKFTLSRSQLLTLVVVVTRVVSDAYRFFQMSFTRVTQ